MPRTFQDPKAPHPRRRPPPRPIVPAARLRRVGATPAALAVYRAWWESHETDTDKTVASAQLAVLTDTALAAQVDDVADLASWPAGRVLAWARNSPSRPLAAKLAIHAETINAGTSEPRAGLIRKLESLK